MPNNCGWCGPVTQDYIEKCITDECAMKPVGSNRSHEVVDKLDRGVLQWDTVHNNNKRDHV